MKFIHLGDSHIGNVYKDQQRNEDIKDAFRQVIDAAIENKVDFVIHSGDLFNEGNPSLPAMLFVTDQLNRLRSAGIKLFIVPGSHDIGIGEEDSIIELFDRNDLLVNMNSKRYVSFLDEEINLKGELYKGAFICGVKGKRSRVEDEVFKKLKIEETPGSLIKIFIFHHTISELGEKFKDLDTDSLPKGFDYYAAGHWHGHRDNIKYDRGIIQYPGSTEYCDEKEIVDNPNRGFYLIDFDESGIRNIEYKIIKTREKEIIELNSSGKTAVQIRDEILGRLKRSDGKLLVIKLSGQMQGKKSELELLKIKNTAKDLGYSYISINLSKLADKDDQSVEINSKDIADVEKEYLVKKGYDEMGLKMAEYIVSNFDSGRKPNELKDELSEIFRRYDNKKN